MKFIKWSVVVIALLVVIWLARQEKAITVTWQAPIIGSVETIVANTRSGTVEACQRSKLSFPIGGQIEHIYVNEGDLVKQGQKLMSLWQQDRLAKLTEASALIRARKQHQQSICIAADNDKKYVIRNKQLLKQKLTSQERLDNALAKADASAAACLQAKAEVDIGQAMKQTAQASLAQTELYAPFDGMVAEITGELGEYATPSPPGITMPPAIDILTHDCHYVSAPIDEIDAGQLQLAMPVIITIDAFEEQRFSGRIERISPYVQDYAKQARTVDVDVKFTDTLALPSQPLLTGYSTDIEITVKKTVDAIRIASELVVDNEYVYILDGNNIIQRKKITKGLSNWRYTEVVSGLTVKDKVISSLAIKGLAAGVKATGEQVTHDNSTD